MRSATRSVALRRLWDVAIVIALVLLAGYGWVRDPRWATGEYLPAAVHTVAAGLGCLALLWRRSRPLPVLYGTAALGVLATATQYGSGAFVLPAAIACCTAISLGLRRAGIVVAAVLAVLLVAIQLLRGAAWNSDPIELTVLALGLGVALGLWFDARRSVLQAARDRADRAESLREAEAQQAVLTERLRIARELHDVLAHQIAVISTQSGLAEYVVDTDPAAAREAFGHIRTASGSALAELATILELLRRSEDGRAAPAPSLDRLDALLDEVRATGLEVESTVAGTVRPLPPVVDLAGYRIIQEGLTNAHKHGTGKASVRVSYEPAAVGIEVTNPVSQGRATAPGSGFGVAGMRERAEALGGRLVVARQGASYRLQAFLPAAAELDPSAVRGGD